MKKRAEAGVIGAIGSWTKALIVLVVLLIIIAGAFALTRGNFLDFFDSFRPG